MSEPNCERCGRLAWACARTKAICDKLYDQRRKTARELICWAMVLNIGPEMVAEGWIVMGGDALFWMHPPSQRCIDLHEAPREQCQVPCWGPEPASPKAPGFFVACRVHGEGGDPLYGDAFWVESREVAFKMARKIRADILAETPSQARERRREMERRGNEVNDQLFAWARQNERIAGGG